LISASLVKITLTNGIRYVIVFNEEMVWLNKKVYRG